MRHSSILRLILGFVSGVAFGGCSPSAADLSFSEAVKKAQEHDARQEYAEAAEYYTVALDRDPTNATVLNNRAAVYASMKQYENAFADLNKAIEHGGNRSSLPYLHRAALLFHANRLDEALADVNQAIVIDPKHAEAYWIRGTILTIQEKPRQGERDLQRARDLGFRPQNAPATQ